MARSTSTPLLGFKAPFVNDSEIVVPVLTGAGEWHELRATPVTWERLGRAIRGLQEARTQQPAATPAPAGAPIPKPGGRLL